MAAGLSSSGRASAQQAADFAWRDSWRRMHPVEGAMGGALGGGSLVLALTNPYLDTGWSGGMLFDEPVRRAVVARSRTVRDAATYTSYVLYGILMAQPVVLDPLLIRRYDADTALQTSAIASVALGLAGFTSFASQALTGRQRPVAAMCAIDPTYSKDCGDSQAVRHASFVSGHTLVAFTDAGLTCVHHEHLPIYGGAAADTAACIAALSGAGIVGLLRLVADQNFASDVLAGATLGALFGYGLPTLWHYRTDSAAN